jgi:hypothetical protein
VLIPVSAVSGWARVQLHDEDAFVATFAPLAHDGAVHDALVDEASRAIAARVDFDALTRHVVDELAELGLGPRATAALRLLEQPAAAGLRSAAEDAVDSVVRSPRFASLWSTAMRATHRVLTTAATFDGGEVVALTDRGVVVRLGPVVDGARDRVGGVSEAAASLLPHIDREVVVAPGTVLAQIRAAYSMVTAVGWWAPLITIVLLSAGVVVARRRADAVIGVGVALIAGALLLWIAIAVGGSAASSAARGSALWTAAIDSAYGSVVLPLDMTARIVAVVGAAVTLGTGAARWLTRRAPVRPATPSGADDSVPS